MAKYGMYPQPVYHATLDDGRTFRMTVWQKANAAEKGFDWEACRRTVLLCSDTNTAPVRDQFGLLTYASLEATGCKIIAAHLEQAGEHLADDPLQAPKAKPVKRPNMAKWYEAAIPAFHAAVRLANRAGDHDLAERFRALCNGTVDAHNAAGAD